MNACEDQSEPLGEAPEIDPRAQVMRDVLAAAEAHGAKAINMHPNTLAWLRGEESSAVPKMIAAADRITNQAKAIEELRKLHRCCEHDPEICNMCDGCEYPWPCNTIRLLDGLGV